MRKLLFLSFFFTTIHASNLNFEIAAIEWTQIQSEIFNLINKRYCKQPSKEDFDKAIIRGLNSFAKLDPHSGVLDLKSCKHLSEKTSGEFCGIGVALPGDKDCEDEFIPIIETVPGGPSDKAGIKAGDRIIQIDDSLVRGLSIDEVTSKLKGEKNTIIKVRISRDKHPDTIDFEIKRDTIKDDISLSFYFEKHKIYYLFLSIFSEKSIEQIEKLLKKTDEKKCNGIILDLRNNTGGLFESALDIAGLFLPKKTLIATTKTRNNKIIEQWRTSRNPMKFNTEIPIFILVNNYTASAAEILAGSLSLHSLNNTGFKKLKVFIVGTRTFGKGSIQEVIPLSNSCALKLTTALYYLPFNTSIQGEGIEPDIIIEPKMPPSDAMLWIMESYGRESSLKGHIVPEDKKMKHEKTNKQLKKINKELSWKEQKQELISNDYQIQSTIQLIKLLSFNKSKDRSKKTLLSFLKDNFCLEKQIELEEIKF